MHIFYICLSSNNYTPFNLFPKCDFSCMSSECCIQQQFLMSWCVIHDCISLPEIPSTSGWSMLEGSVYQSGGFALVSVLLSRRPFPKLLPILMLMYKSCCSFCFVLILVRIGLEGISLCHTTLTCFKHFHHLCFPTWAPLLASCLVCCQAQTPEMRGSGHPRFQ